MAVTLFVLALKWLSSPATAKHGVLAGEFGAVLAVTATLCDYQIIEYKWIIVALVVGAIVGIPLGLVPMTAVPQRTALSHAFGALAAAMIGIAEYYVRVPHLTKFEMVEIALEVIIGSLTFTGSLIAAGEVAGSAAAAAHYLPRAELRQPVGARGGHPDRALADVSSRVLAAFSR